MKQRLFVLIFCTIIAPQIAVAQYSFTVTYSTSGNCNYNFGDGYGLNMDYLWRSVGQQIGMQGGNTASFSSKDQCESARLQLLSYSSVVSIYNCTLHITPTPCTGFGGNGGINLTGPDQGYSFYSTNAIDEILNWNIDDEQRQKALNYDYEAYAEAQYINTGDENFNKEREKERNGWYLDTDKPFRSLNVDASSGINTHSEDYKTQDITNEQLWYADLKDYELFSKYLAEYYLLTGIDIENILSKEEKTPEDLELIFQFEKWSDEKIAEEERYMDMAISSALAYSKEEEKNLLLSNTSNIIITNQIPKDSPLYKLNLLINLCNIDTENNQGFHADLLYNENTNEYTVAFRGSEEDPKMGMLAFVGEIAKDIIYEPMKHYLIGAEDFYNKYKHFFSPILLFSPKSNLINDFYKKDNKYSDWSDTNISQNIIGEVPTQYRMAIEIGDLIRQIKEENPDIKINITGHSLGGGLGITAGVVSGQPTYVFNPAGVNHNTFEYAGVSEKVEKREYNITKFTTDDDILTNTQEKVQKYGPNVIKYINNILKEDIDSDSFFKKHIPQAIGEKVTIHTGRGHDMTPIAQLFTSNNSKNKRMRRLFSNKNNMNKCRIYTEE